jgi:hypothetical protein
MVPRQTAKALTHDADEPPLGVAGVVRLAVAMFLAAVQAQQPGPGVPRRLPARRAPEGMTGATGPAAGRPSRGNRA